jgi:hypothetical protein
VHYSYLTQTKIEPVTKKVYVAHDFAVGDRIRWKRWPDHTYEVLEVTIDDDDLVGYTLRNTETRIVNRNMLADAVVAELAPPPFEQQTSATYTITITETTTPHAPWKGASDVSVAQFIAEAVEALNDRGGHEFAVRGSQVTAMFGFPRSMKFQDPYF